MEKGPLTPCVMLSGGLSDGVLYSVIFFSSCCAFVFDNSRLLVEWNY